MVWTFQQKIVERQILSNVKKFRIAIFFWSVYEGYREMGWKQFCRASQAQWITI
jgi:hypothetical protein